MTPTHICGRKPTIISTEDGRSPRQKGGSLYTAPEIVILDDPEPDGQPLRFIDIPAMIEKNQDLLEKLAAETIKKYTTFM